MKFQPVSTPRSTIDLTQGNGLPYWIFWFLVCVIFLLVVFIFLRDRDLRKKLDSFFFGARKKFSKLRLQVQIRLEEKKKNQILMEIGEKAWQKRIQPNLGEGLRNRLDTIEEKKGEMKERINKLDQEIFLLKQQLGDVDQTFSSQLKDLELEINPLKDKLAILEKQEEEIIDEITRLHHQEQKLARQINNLKREINHEEGEKAPKREGHFESTYYWLEEKKKEFTRTLRARLNQQKEVENKKRSLEEKMELLEKKKKTVDEVEIKKKDIQSRIVRNDQEKGKLLRRYDKLQEEMKPLFISLGEILEGKIKNEDSMMLYAHQLERINKNLLEMKKQLKEL